MKTDSPSLQKAHYAHHLRLEGGVFERVGIGHVGRQDPGVPGLAGEAGRMKAGASGMGVLRMTRKDVNKEKADKERAEAKEKDKAIAKEREREKERNKTSPSTTRHKSGERPKQPEPTTPLLVKTLSQTPSLSPTAVRTPGTGATNSSMIDPALMAMNAPPNPPHPPQHPSGVHSDPSHPAMIYIPGSGSWYVLPSSSPTGQIYNGPLPTSQNPLPSQPAPAVGADGRVPNPIQRVRPPGSMTGAFSLSMSMSPPGPSPLPTPPSSVTALPAASTVGPAPASAPAPVFAPSQQAEAPRLSQSPVTLVVTEDPRASGKSMADATPTPKHPNSHRLKPPAPKSVPAPAPAPAPSYQGYQGQAWGASQLQSPVAMYQPLPPYAHLPQSLQQPPPPSPRLPPGPRHPTPTWSTFQQLELMEWVAQDEKERWRRASHRFGRSVEECVREAEAIGYKVFKLGPSNGGGR